MVILIHIYIGQRKYIKMNNFEPTILGMTVFVISIAEINAVLQGLLLIATLVYTVIKIKQLLKPNK